MRATILDTLERPLDEVERRLLAPTFPAELAAAAPMLRDVTVTRETTDERSLSREATYRLDPAGLGLLARFGEVGWTEHVTWSRERHRGEVVVHPLVPRFVAERLACEATYVLEARGGETLRRVEVHVEVRVPGIGGVIERRVVELLRQLFATERELLATRS
jgi:hypothetical protein